MTIKTIAASLALTLASLAVTAQADPVDDKLSYKNAVSFLTTVAPNTASTALTVQHGVTQLGGDQLNALLRPGGGYLLRVTGIHAFVTWPNVTTDFARVALVACGERDDVRGFGAGSLLVGWTNTDQASFDPGLAVSLHEHESLCVLSFVQSNEDAQVEVHGYLEPIEKSE